MSDQEKLKIFNEMRRITDLTGQVFEAQVTTLKAICYILMESHVEIAMNTDERTVTVTGRKEPPAGAVEKLKKSIASVLTPRWKVQVCYDTKDGTPEPAKGTPSWTNGKRAGRLSKVRRKR
jgi:hypothetical protein